jgi:hypothetical protein
MPSPIPYETSDLVVSYKERVVAYLDILIWSSKNGHSVKLL